MMKGAKEGVFVWLKIEAIGFDDTEKLKVLTPQIYKFFEDQLKIDQVWPVTLTTFMNFIILWKFFRVVW